MIEDIIGRGHTSSVRGPVSLTLSAMKEMEAVVAWWWGCSLLKGFSGHLEQFPLYPPPPPLGNTKQRLLHPQSQLLFIICIGRFLRALGAPPRCSLGLPRKPKGRPAAPANASPFLDIHGIGRLLGALGAPPSSPRRLPGKAKGRRAAPTKATPVFGINGIGRLLRALGAPPRSPLRPPRKTEGRRAASTNAFPFLDIHGIGRLLGALGAPPRSPRRLPRKTKGRNAAPAKASPVLDIDCSGRLLRALGAPPSIVPDGSPGRPKEGWLLPQRHLLLLTSTALGGLSGHLEHHLAAP